MHRLSCLLPCFLVALVLSINPGLARAECEHGFHLEGTLSVKDCDPKVDDCINGIRAIYEYGEKLDDGGDEVLTISIMSSPWRIYGPEMRIMRMRELTEIVKANLTEKIKSVVLYASWTENIPKGRTKSLSQELSESLKGFPVKGIDGFLWIKGNGDYYSTKQAFTIGGDFPYHIKDGDDLMVALPYGAFVHAQDHFIKEKNLRGLRYAAVGWDVFILCPDKALATFEMAAELSDTISAYNAAVIRLERGQEGDFEGATKLLTQAANAGDEKAQALLVEIKAN